MKDEDEDDNDDGNDSSFIWTHQFYLLTYSTQNHAISEIIQVED